VSAGEQKITHSTEYNSHNTERLDVEGMTKLLMRLDFINELKNFGTSNSLV
jgi:UDP-glucose 4-epimerase